MKEDFVKQNFRFPSYVNLRRHLGEYDALVELNELAVRSLLHRISPDPLKLLKAESVLHEIRVDHNDQSTDSEFSARRTQFYVLSVYQQAEQFLYEFVNDLPQGKRWRALTGALARKSEESELDWLIRTIRKECPEALNDKADADFFDDIDIFTYFRLVRNAFMHEGKETRQLINQFNKLETRGRGLSAIPAVEESNKQHRIRSFAVPNRYNELLFSDFILFTRVVKSIAFRLCGVLKPSIDDLLHHKFSPLMHHGLRKYLNNVNRFETACKNRLKMDYNLTDEEIVYSIPIIRGLIIGP